MGAPQAAKYPQIRLEIGPPVGGIAGGALGVFPLPPPSDLIYGGGYHLGDPPSTRIEGAEGFAPRVTRASPPYIAVGSWGVCVKMTMKYIPTGLTLRPDHLFAAGE